MLVEVGDNKSRAGGLWCERDLRLRHGYSKHVHATPTDINNTLFVSHFRVVLPFHGEREWDLILQVAYRFHLWYSSYNTHNSKKEHDRNTPNTHSCIKVKKKKVESEPESAFMRLSLPLESPFLDKEDDIDEIDLGTLVIDDETAERRRESIHQDVSSRRHHSLTHIILVWLEELDPTLYPPRARPVSTRLDINLSTLRLLRRFVAGASHDKTFEPEWTPLVIVVLRTPAHQSINDATIVYQTRTTFSQARPVPQWVTDYFELDTSLSTVSLSPPLSPPTVPSPDPLNPLSPYPSPPLSPLFHTPPSSPPAFQSQALSVELPWRPPYQLSVEE
ncbi:hypothetical protein M422DRAFT_256498 [Sphaerobolus stellatus SS14]|uniref:Unplaced genomic scaffold SPHSTscaffold_68, whole genome shotgun sequence n=1 Tax=Sphaerobolus stellatus (strain SS14) TaxID=990650 RepID=A0A0C9V0B1_SPHS4|nr:hypothetical protein M422DRAFT_256498 [Sphaerobolus stellatus SS14]